MLQYFYPNLAPPTNSYSNSGLHCQQRHGSSDQREVVRPRCLQHLLGQIQTCHRHDRHTRIFTRLRPYCPFAMRKKVHSDIGRRAAAVEVEPSPRVTNIVPSFCSIDRWYTSAVNPIIQEKQLLSSGCRRCVQRIALLSSFYSCTNICYHHHHHL